MVDTQSLKERQAEKQAENKTAEKPVANAAEPKPAVNAVEKTEPTKEAAKEKATETAKETKELPVGKAKLEAKKEDKKTELVLKRIVIIPLSEAYAKPAKKRAAKAIKMMREYGARHSKSLITNVKIDSKLASFVNARGSKKPPKKLKVLLTKDKQGNVKLAPA